MSGMGSRARRVEATRRAYADVYRLRGAEMPQPPFGNERQDRIYAQQYAKYRRSYWHMERMIAEFAGAYGYTAESRIKPRCSMSDPPKDGQRVNYWFAPFEQWHTGTYQSPAKDGGAGFFSGRSGFCDHHDAPWWLPLPPAPEAAS